ncbi:hypothetical protein BGZ83_007722 [Gryganskiella cystojenkinii]|nr:hypothetical protein BGZ83_007722 [Gryganskiella cystojenkinii]
MQDQPKTIPSWQTVFNLPELCDIVLINLTPPDLARLSRVSHAFHSLWAPRLWHSIIHTSESFDLPLPEDIEVHCPLVREVRFSLGRRRTHDLKLGPVVDRVRTRCQNLRTVQFSFFGRHGDTTIFQDRVLGVPPEVLDEIFQPYRSQSHYNFTETGTTIMLEFCQLLQVDAGKNNSSGKEKQKGEQQQEPTVWYRPLIPCSPANGFLSSTIRSLDLAAELEYTDHVLAWLTRAGWEGHLQGLVQLQLNTERNPHRPLANPIKIERELFLQCLEAFPRLSELIAPQLQVIVDVVRRGNQKSRIHADILDPLNDHPMAKNLAARRLRPLKIQKLALWSLGLGGDIGETSQAPLSSSTLLSAQESWSALLCRFPYLTDLNFVYESIPDLVSALNHPLRRHFAATAIQPITRLTMRLCGREKGVTAPMLPSWRSLLLSPALRLETLDIRSRHDMPLKLLDHLVTSSSIKSLKRVICCPHGRDEVESSSVQRFFRSAIWLEEFQCSRTTSFVIEEFFTAEESARWPCRDRLRSLKFLTSHVDLRGSEFHSAQMRRWVWSFGPGLKELVIRGIHATVDILLEPSSCTSFPSSSSLWSLPATLLPSPPCLKIYELTLPVFQESSVLTLNQTKFAFGQLLRQTHLESCFCRFDEESVSWLEKERLDVHDGFLDLRFFEETYDQHP